MLTIRTYVVNGTFNADHATPNDGPVARFAMPHLVGHGPNLTRKGAGASSTEGPWTESHARRCRC